MCVTGADHVLRADIVEFSTAKSCCHARGNSQSSQHHRHSRGEVFAMSLLAFEKEIGQRVRLRSSGKSKRISEPSAKVGFDRGGFVVLVRRCRSNLSGQFRDTRMKRRQLAISLRDIEWIFLGRGSQVLGIRLPDGGSCLVPTHRMFRIQITHAASMAECYRLIRPFQNLCERSEKKNVG